MASALDKLIATPPQEYGGSRASNRFAYQRDWTFCLLLKLHLGTDDYLVVCEGYARNVRKGVGFMLGRSRWQ
jgi:hypothetical protein